MRVDQFDFDLPQSCIAQSPSEPRDAAKLLYVSQKLADHTVADLPNLLQPGDCMVVNNTKVIPTRIQLPVNGKPVEVTLIDKTSPSHWYGFAKPGRRLKTGMAIDLDGHATISVADKLPDGRILFAFDRDDADIFALFNKIGAMPLPPYIKREAARSSDARDYQTIFAQNDGAVAAPTAGLHFTDRLLNACAERGVERVELTLHVGAGTFLPVKADDTADHQMHSEEIILPEDSAAAINKAIGEGRRIVAVGTTVLRTLEALAVKTGEVRAGHDRTDLFITPGYRFKIVDLLLTNFHLPRSTLFMLVSAFAGLERMQAAYAHAIAANYRFFSYGDATLLERADRP